MAVRKLDLLNRSETGHNFKCESYTGKIRGELILIKGRPTGRSTERSGFGAKPVLGGLFDNATHGSDAFQPEGSARCDVRLSGGK